LSAGGLPFQELDFEGQPERKRKTCPEAFSACRKKLHAEKSQEL
jgi:hypothetical protein